MKSRANRARNTQGGALGRSNRSGFQLKFRTRRAEIRAPCALRRFNDTVHQFHFEETLMTTFRMFAFFAAVLVTACLFRAFAYGLTAPPHAAAGTSVYLRSAAN